MAKIVLKGTPNIREFGGIENRLGNEVLYKKFLRSGELSKLTKEDIEMMRTKYNLSKIIDLRNTSEVMEKPNVHIPGCEEVNIPLLKDDIPGFTTETNNKKAPQVNLSEVYVALTSDFTLNQIKKVFEVIMKADAPVMWISSNGRDRVGIISAIFLKILDVEDDVILKDYLFSNECLKSGGLKGLFGKNKADPHDAKPEYLNMFFDVLDRMYGGADKFIEKELGVTKEVKKAFQKKCLLIL